MRISVVARGKRTLSTHGYIGKEENYAGIKQINVINQLLLN